MLIFVIAVSVVLVVSFMCSIAESVLLSLSRPQIETMIQAGKRAGTLMARFKDNIDVPIAAILILNTAAHTIGAAVAGASYSSAFNADTLWLFSILFTLAVLLFTEIIPKTLGVTHAAGLATPVAHGVDWMARLLLPLVRVSEAISRSLRRDASRPVTSAEEIRLMAMLGRSEGAVSARTADMIVGAAQLRHVDTADVMLPRRGVRFLHAEMTREEVNAAIRRWGHSRYPFSTTHDLDNVTGTVLVKDLLYWMQDHPEGPVDWDSLVREALIVPESMQATRLLRTFQQSHRHQAIVVDEYGNIEGIVTLEDVLEELVGEIVDESDAPLDDIRERYDGALVMRASIDMRKVSARLGVVWDAESEVTTIGGLVTETLERIPVVGDFIDWQGYRIEVVTADRRSVKMVAIRPLPEGADEGDEK
ncbi:MAG: hemolysin family protein [Woeseiaceae bacterium]|nr:hemolysin family protein [Woeseiaceae bacterium]